MMKNVMLVCVFIIIHVLIFGQNINNKKSEKTQIYIVGVVHTANEVRDSDNLLIILKDIKPDLILNEGDSTTTFFPKEYLLSKPPWWYNVGRKLRILKKMPPETEVLFDYKKFNRSINILPFDIRIIDRRKYFKNYYQTKSKWFSVFNSLVEENIVPSSLNDVHSTYIKYNKWLNYTANKSYKEINNPNVIDSTRKMMKFEEEYLPILIESIQSLSVYKNWYTDKISFWKQRNEVMAQNIIRFIELTKAKQVVVFTGLLHKYILLDLLNSYNTDGEYEIVEYFE